MKVTQFDYDESAAYYDLHSLDGIKLGAVRHDITPNRAYFITNESVENDLQAMRKIVQFMESITL